MAGRGLTGRLPPEPSRSLQRLRLAAHLRVVQKSLPNERPEKQGVMGWRTKKYIYTGHRWRAAPANY